MYVVATAGHVDHGKSTLVRALTGMEPDRWAEEKRRGLTIDLGFVWTGLDSGREVAFVDVPGHERFLANMLAGLGPAPAVCFVVAADEGWQAQSGDHRDAIAAWGIRHGIIVVTKADRAPDRVDAVLAQARAELAGTGLAGAPAAIVSSSSGQGLEDLRSGLDRMLAGLPVPEASGRVRLWVDRAFTVTGAGTVVTGTLTAGTLSEGDPLEVLGSNGDGARAVTVRALHSRNQPQPSLGPTQRVAVNLRGATSGDLSRGDALVTPGAWPQSAVVDIRSTTGADLGAAPRQLLVHLGTATVPARVRPFGPGYARLSMDRPLPLVPGDRLVLRDPGGHAVVGGAVALDVDPPAMDRRGDGSRRATTLHAMPDDGDAALEIERRGAVRESFLARLGLTGPAEVPGDDSGILLLAGWWIDPTVLQRWTADLGDAVREVAERDPLAAGLSRGAGADVLRAAFAHHPDGAPAGVNDPAVLDAVAAEAGLVHDGGYLRVPGASRYLGPAETAVAGIEARLAERPFAAPEGDELTAWGLGVRELAAAERTGRLIRLAATVVLLPSAPARAMRELARLDQPFTASQARQALGTSRRVAIPLLERLDGLGWTRRVDGSRREVVR